MSIFEIGMLLCFGLAWPFSIYRSYTSRQNTGKSLTFLFILLLGYILGIFHKIFYNFDSVIYLYLLNSVLVSIDIALFFRNKHFGNGKK